MNNTGALQESQKARNYCFYLLKFRQRSEREIRQRLAKKKFAPETIDRAVEFLKEKKFLDDAGFAQAWIESRLRRPYGLRKVFAELRQKGIAREIIDSEIARIKEDYSEEDVVRSIIKVRFNRSKDPLKEKKRLYAYLLRRGFSPETVNDIISEL